MNFNKSKKSNGGANKNGRVEEGTYMSRIVQVVDLGVQKGEYKGEEYVRPEVLITFEFPTETININGEDKPRWVSKTYTVSMNEKSALFALVNAADPDGKATKRGTKADGLLGLPLMVTVGSTASGNAKIVGVSRLMKGMAVPELANPSVFFDLDSSSDENKEVFESLPDWIKEKINSSMNLSTTAFSTGAKKQKDPVEEDNPF